MTQQTDPAESPAPPTGGDLVRRHGLVTRIWHWLNAVTVIVLLMSGLMILNAHPRLYWGHYGANFDAAWLTLPRFPGWATIPTGYNLALAREWHFAFAWVFAFGLLFFMLRALMNGHFRRDIALGAKEVAPSHLWEDVKRHLHLNFETPGGGYNPLQKITYSLVLFVLFLLAKLGTEIPALPEAFRAALETNLSHSHIALLRFANFAMMVLLAVWLIEVGPSHPNRLIRAAARGLRGLMTWQ